MDTHSPTTPEQAEELAVELRDDVEIIADDELAQLEEHLEQQNFNALRGLDSPDSQASAADLRSRPLR